jgi:hypothetical protein
VSRLYYLALARQAGIAAFVAASLGASKDARILARVAARAYNDYVRRRDAERERRGQR